MTASQHRSTAFRGKFKSVLDMANVREQSESSLRKWAILLSFVLMLVVTFVSTQNSKPLS
jgi:hypothetical protein